MLYKGLENKASIPIDDFIQSERLIRNMQQVAFRPPHARTDIYIEFFTRTVRDWNKLPSSFLYSAEYAEDCVTRFTILVRSRDTDSLQIHMLALCIESLNI